MAVVKNIALNGLAQIGNRVVRILEQLLLVPFFLSCWGSDYYGEWLTISMIPSVLAFSDLGFGTAVSNSFVLTYSNNDKQKAANTYITGLLVISITIVLGIVLSIFVVGSAWRMNVLEKSLIAPSDIVVSLSLLMASRLATFYMQLFEGFFRAKQKAATAYNLHSVESLLRIGIGALTLYIGCDIVGYAWGQFLVAIAFNVIFAWLSLRLIKDLPRGEVKKSIAKDTLKKGFGFMLTPIWQSIYMQGSTFVVRIVLGPAAVAVFNTVRTVCKSINAIFAVVNGSIFPEIQVAYGKGDLNLVKIIYISALQIVSVIALVGLVFLILFGPTLYGWWTHNELVVDSYVWYIFMLGIPLNALWWTAGTVFRATNNPMRFSINGFISAVISTGISWILAYPLGIAGAAIGFVAMDFIMLVIIVPLSNREIGVPFSDLFKLEYGYNRLLNRK